MSKILEEYDSGYSIGKLYVKSGENHGISARGQFIEIDKNLCRDLEKGEDKSLLISYSIIGPYGCEFPRTEIFTLSHSQQGPVILNPFRKKVHIRGDRFCFDVLSDSQRAAH